MAYILQKSLHFSSRIIKNSSKISCLFRSVATARYQTGLLVKYGKTGAPVLSSCLIKEGSALYCSFRTIITTKCLKDNYEGDGKTTVTILNKDLQYLILVNSYSSLGFRLNNGVFVMGPIAVFPRTVLQWNVNSISELTPESVSLFCLLEPKLDILIIGTGSKMAKLPTDVEEFLKDNKIHAEVLPTDKACSSFNFLNSEGRCLAAAFIPPEDVVIYQEEMALLSEIEAMDDYSIVSTDKKLKQ